MSHTHENEICCSFCGKTQDEVARLVEGMKIDEAIRRLKGIKCGFRPTSCPDQLARALEKMLESSEN